MPCESLKIAVVLSWLIVCTFPECQRGTNAMQTGLTILLALIVAFGSLAAPAVSDAGQRIRGRARASEENPGASQNSQENPGRRLSGSRLYQDPASTAGYENGYEHGLHDGQDGQRYDPVRHRGYRDGQRGYTSSYGSKDSYKTNFRTGFRRGYEDGYREGSRTR